jgi:L-malate glycosyltransferase
LKIHLVSNMYPNKKAPNYGVFVKNTEEILKETGHQITKTIMNKHTNNFLKALFYMKYYISIILKSILFKFDVLYVHYAAHNALPLLILKKIRPNMVIYTNVHGSDVVPESSTHDKLQKYVELLLINSNKIIVPSLYYKKKIREKYNLVNNNIEVFPSGGVNKMVFNQSFEKDQLFQELKLKNEFKYIGYVGRIDYKKGWDILLKTLHLLKEQGFLDDKKAIFVGSGKYLNEFNKQVHDYGLGNDIIYYDFLPQNELNKIFNCLDVFCFPTMREGESLGLVGLESMACGTPVIGSNIGGLLDYIKDGKNGLLFKVGDSKDLKNKLIKFFNYNSEELAAVERYCLQTAEEYESDNIKNKLASIF